MGKSCVKVGKSFEIWSSHQTKIENERLVESSNQNERLNGTIIDTDYYDVSALRGYRGETD